MRNVRLGRNQGHRKALLRNQVASLIMHGRIRTTDTKAKAIQPLVEKMVTLGKKGDLAARRQVASFLNQPKAVNTLFESIAPKYMERNGGYTRILKLGVRQGDNAELAVIEFV